MYMVIFAIEFEVKVHGIEFLNFITGAKWRAL